MATKLCTIMLKLISKVLNHCTKRDANSQYPTLKDEKCIQGNSTSTMGRTVQKIIVMVADTAQPISLLSGLRKTRTKEIVSMKKI